MSQDNNVFDVALESDYHYSFNQLVGQMEANVLNMQAFFQQGDLIQEDLNLIAEELKSTAVKFAQEQGLGGGTSLLHYGKAIKNSFGTVVGHNIGSVAAKGPTGNLIANIETEVSGQKISLVNRAINSREQYYAGHIEFGFHDRGGGMVPARPFMRPALYAVADASKGQISGTLKRYLEQMWSLEPLQFGSVNISRGRAREFYKGAMNPKAKGYGRYTISRLPKGRFSEMRTRDNRMRYTVDRNLSGTKGTYSNRVSSRMGYKPGKDQSGREHLTDTRWSSSSKSSSKQSSSYSSGNAKQYSSKQPSSYSSGNTEQYSSSSKGNLLYGHKGVRNYY